MHGSWGAFLELFRTTRRFSGGLGEFKGGVYSLSEVYGELRSSAEQCGVFQDIAEQFMRCEVFADLAPGKSEGFSGNVAPGRSEVLSPSDWSGIKILGARFPRS